MDINYIIEKVTEEVYKQLECNAPVDNASAANLAGVIEHSLLNPDADSAMIQKGCEEARKYGFANVCVSPYYAGMATDLLKESEVAVCVPIGFPHGAASTKAKCTEVREAIMSGATELDISLVINAIKSDDFEFVKKDLCEMMDVSGGRAKVKVIFEQGLLTEEQKVKTLNIASQCGVDFIKISNALTGKKACTEDVQYVRSIIGPDIGIKIDGGIKDAKTVQSLLNASANRLGCSASVKIVTGQ